MKLTKDGESLKAKSKIIVIPNRSNYVLAWCLEYAIYSRKQGFLVDIVDVSRLNARYLEKPNRWVIDSHSSKRRSSREKYIKKICKEHGIVNLTNLINWRVGFESKVMNQKTRSYFNVAVRSSYARWYGSSDILVDNIPPSLLAYEEMSFNLVHDEILVLLKRKQYSEITTVNGRFVPDAAAILAGIDMGIPYRMLEKMTEDWSHYVPFKVSAQSLSERDQIIIEEWGNLAKGSIEKKVERAREHLNFRSSNDWIWQNNTRLELPSEIDYTRPYVVFYLTSDYEFPVYGEETSAPAISQDDSVKETSRICKQLNLQLVVKGHPHPGELRLSEIEDRKWQKICDFLGVIYLKCDAGYSSLKLAGKSHCNIVYGSTLAIDFVVNNLPVVATGPTDYTTLIPEICAFEKEKLETLIQNPLKDIDPQRLYPWVFSCIEAGIPMNNFKISDDMKVSYKGEAIDEPLKTLLKLRMVFARVMGRTGHGLSERF